MQEFPRPSVFEILQIKIKGFLPSYSVVRAWKNESTEEKLFDNRWRNLEFGRTLPWTREYIPVEWHYSIICVLDASNLFPSWKLTLLHMPILRWVKFLFSFFYFSSPFIFIGWRLITLQYCSGFCHTLTWISYGFTCIPHPDPPSHLPPHPIPLGLPSAPTPSTCLMHPTWAGDLFHPR